MERLASSALDTGLAMCTAEVLSLLTRVEQPIWIYDFGRHRVVWANPPALGLWRAQDLAELQQRNFDPTSLGTAERLANMQSRLAQGERTTELWTLYPRGEPVQVRCRFTGLILPDQSVGMMAEVVPPDALEQETSYELRAVEAVRQTPLMISLATPQGAWLMHNPAAETLLRRLGPPLCDDGFLGLFRERPAAAALRRKAVRTGSAQATLRLTGRTLRVHDVTVRRLIDPATGQLSLIVSQQDVTRTFRLEQRLKTALSRERALAELQRQFLAITSHDFRTPLSIIDNAARRIERQPDDARAAADRAGSIRKAVRRMSDSIDKTLANAMLADGKTAFHPQRIDLRPILRHAMANQEVLHPDRAILANVPHLSQVDADPVLVERVFENLLSNAIKYSPRDSTIEVTAKLQSDAVVVTVIDHGIGVPAAEIPKLFARYYRSSNARGVKGTGVGLHAVRLFMDLHGGRVDLQSREGEGTRVSVTFPLPAAG